MSAHLHLLDDLLLRKRAEERNPIRQTGLRRLRLESLTFRPIPDNPQRHPSAAADEIFHRLQKNVVPLALM